MFYSYSRPSPTDIYTLSLHDALPIYRVVVGGTHTPFGIDRIAIAPRIRVNRPIHVRAAPRIAASGVVGIRGVRSEEHTSELQSQSNLVCRLLLEKKKITSNSFGNVLF